MSSRTQPQLQIAIACGGTGGHLFPGLAVAEQLVRRECSVTLLISPKDVDKQATRGLTGMEIVSLPAVALQRGSKFAFVRGFCSSYWAAKKLFRKRVPHVALAMGGFTSAPPVLAARAFGARSFLHESNAVPGRANRWLSRVVDCACVGFPASAARLHAGKVVVTGTPTRSQIRPTNVAAARAALGLDPARPVMAVLGGSQGASAINEMVMDALPALVKTLPSLQWIHLSGPRDFQKVQSAYAALPVTAVVHSFYAEMETVLASASAAISRAGASSLAELAALRLPSILVPYPSATDNHQLHNARAFVDTGAALLLEQSGAGSQNLIPMVMDVVDNPRVREDLRIALAHWHSPRAASQIAEMTMQAACEVIVTSSGRATGSGNFERSESADSIRAYEPAPKT